MKAPRAREPARTPQLRQQAAANGAGMRAPNRWSWRRRRTRTARAAEPARPSAEQARRRAQRTEARSPSLFVCVHSTVRFP
eukprot:3767538-Prymnesium_polylepis.1